MLGNFYSSISSKPKLLFVMLVFLTFLSQPYKVGFEKGHHGWVSSHTLAIITRATPQNYFLGYTRDVVTEHGPDKEYFDRYPVLFSGSINLLLSPFWDNLKSYIYVSRQLMNIIYLLTVWLTFLILRKLTKPSIALTATIIFSSTAYLVKYKDMVHFDQPALLGCLLALNGIVDFEMNGKKKFLYWAALFGTLLGRGYATIAFLLSWVIIRTIKNIKQKTSFKGLLNDSSIRFFLLSIPLPALMLFWNIYSEAHVRNVPLIDTSIVVSARHRLGLTSYVASTGQEKEFKWGSFTSNQIQRALDAMTPYAFYGVHVKDYKAKVKHYTSLVPKLLFQLFLLYLFWKNGRKFYLTLDEQKKTIMQSFVFSGVFWILLMRNLANYHEYVSIYLIGLLICMCWFLAETLEEEYATVLKFIPVLMILSFVLNFAREQYVSSTINWQAEEFQRVREELKNKKKSVVFIGSDFYKFFEGVPHCADFMLSGYKLTTQRSLSDVSLEREGEFKLKLTE